MGGRGHEITGIQYQEYLGKGYLRDAPGQCSTPSPASPAA